MQEALQTSMLLLNLGGKKFPTGKSAQPKDAIKKPRKINLKETEMWVLDYGVYI